MHKMVPQGPQHYIFGDQFYSKNARKLKFHVVLHFNARKHMISSFYLKWTILPNIYIYIIYIYIYIYSSGPRELTIETKFKISCEFRRLQVKCWYHMFSSMKKEEYMESELSDIFQVKVVTKNIVFGSLGPNAKLLLQYDVSF